jgi:hypothetical protein
MESLSHLTKCPISMRWFQDFVVLWLWLRIRILELGGKLGITGDTLFIDRYIRCPFYSTSC